MAQAEASKEATKNKKGAISLVGALLAVAVVIGAFFLGAQYFTAKRSITATVCAAGLTKEAVTVYRLPSGLLDKFSLENQASPLVNVPMAPQFAVLDSNKKSVKPDTLSLGSGSEKAVTLTINPKGRVCKIEVLDGVFQVEGPVTVKSKRELQVGKTTYFVGSTLLLSSGGVTGKSGDDLTGTVETGDVVRVMGYRDQAVVLDVLTRAGKVSVSSNIQGARVFVDGSYRGKTPCVVTATPGLREVSVRAEGYIEKKVPVQVASLSEATVAADLVVATGTVNVSSTPPAAGVYVAGELKGKTPLKLPLVPGSYELRVELQGYFPRTYQITVVRDMDQAISATLVKRPQEEGGTTPGGQPGGGPGSDYRFTLKGTVLARNGDIVYVGDRWTECVLAMDVRVQDSSGDIPVGRIQPGGTVSVFGNSASDVKLVNVETAIAARWPFEGNLVRVSSGYKVFGDDSAVKVRIPDGLEVIDEANRSKDAVTNVPPGSRIRFYVDASGEVAWAEYVWRAGLSADGILGSINGAALRVVPSWEDLYVTLSTAVFQDDRRTAFFDLRTGDSVVVAGPFAKDIRFIWVRQRSWTIAEALAVTLSSTAKEGKVLQEYGGNSLKGYPIYAGSSVILSDPQAKRTISASELQYGDRVRLWLDDNRRVSFGEVTLKDDTRMSGVFLGEKAGFYYFGGFVRYVPAQDLITIGLGPGEGIEPGSRVLAAGTAGAINYIEVQSEVEAENQVVGTVLSSKGSLLVRGSFVSATYPYSKDAWFVDWDLRQDGLVSSLFPGDKVVVSVGLGGNAVFVERTYTPPFKLEGTIETISDHTLVISDKVSRKTVTLVDPVAVLKAGQQGGFWLLEAGDKVKVSGRDKSCVDIVIIE